MNMLDVKIVGPGGQIVVAGRYPLPLTLGRGQAAKVQFGADGNDVSRVHAEIVEDGSKLTLIHRSDTRTTQVGQRSVSAPGDRLALGDASVLRIGPYEVSIAKIGADGHRMLSAGEPVAEVRRGSNRSDKPKGAFPLQGSLIAFVADGAGDNPAVAIEKLPPGDPSSLVSRYQAANRRLIMTLMFSGAQGRLDVFEPLASAPVRLNNAVQKRGRAPLSPLDLVTFADLRIEIVKHGEPTLICANDECERVNPYAPHDNCRWCGFKLVDAVSGLRR